MKMRLVDAATAAGRPGFTRNTEGPFIRGSGVAKGQTTYECAACSRVLLETVHAGQFRGIVYQCKCGAHNEEPPV
jgi:hypothetical protein